MEDAAMVDDDRFDGLCEAVARIDERTERTQADVAALMKVVILGNGVPSLVTQVARLDERVVAGLESRAAKLKALGVVATAICGVLVAVLGRAC